MKIALCYSGQPRNIRETFENHQKHLLFSGEHEIDKFAHFWFDESQAGKNFSSEVASAGKWDAGVKEWILENGDFTKVEFEKPRERNLHFLHGLLKPDIRMERPVPATRLAIRRMISMFYSMEQATTLMAQNEEENSFKYDLAFRLRTDSFFRASATGLASESLWGLDHLRHPFGVHVTLGNWRKIYLEEAAAGATTRAVRPAAFLHRGDGGGRVRGIKDQFAFGDSDSMKKYTSVYSNFDRMIEEGALLNPECLLGLNAEINGVEIIDRAHNKCDYGRFGSPRDLNVFLYRNAAAN